MRVPVVNSMVVWLPGVVILCKNIVYATEYDACHVVTCAQPYRGEQT